MFPLVYLMSVHMHVHIGACAFVYGCACLSSYKMSICPFVMMNLHGLSKHVKSVCLIYLQLKSSSFYINWLGCLYAASWSRQ